MENRGVFKKGHEMMSGSEKGWIKPGHPLYSQWKGKKLTKKHKENIGKSHLGQIPWNKGKTGVQICKRVTREKMRLSNNRGWFKKGHSVVPSGEKSHLWKGGITPLNKQIRSSAQYKDWRTAIFKRDDYTCQECGERGGRLEANHIILFSFIIQHERITTFEDALNCKFLWKMNNGETLCKNCHGLYRPTHVTYPHTLKLDLKKITSITS